MNRLEGMLACVALTGAVLYSPADRLIRSFDGGVLPRAKSMVLAQFEPRTLPQNAEIPVQIFATVEPPLPPPIPLPVAAPPAVPSGLDRCLQARVREQLERAHRDIAMAQREQKTALQQAMVAMRERERHTVTQQLKLCKFSLRASAPAPQSGQL